MKITSTLNFAGDPDRVANMFVTPSFVESLAKEMRADSCTSTRIDKGLTAVMTVPSPDIPFAKKILGTKVGLTLTQSWQEPAGNGSRQGKSIVSLAAIPAGLEGALSLRPTPTGSSIDYNGDVFVRLPLISGRLEKMLGEYLSDAVAALERVGNAWLAREGQTKQ